MGYLAGLADQGPDYRALVVVKRAKGSLTYLGESYSLYNIRVPWEAARFWKEERRLKSIGAEYYAEKGRIETTLERDWDSPRRVMSHR